MPTTALLVEIVIVGFSFFLSILPVVALVFQADPKSVLTFYNDVPIQFQLAAAYAAGVTWNRICDQIFHKLDERIIQSKFSSRVNYQAARIKVVLQGESIRDYVGNFRSLIRVCRASTILLAVYSIVIPIYMITASTTLLLGTLSKWGIVLLVLLLFVASAYSWLRLERGYVAAIHDAYAVILDHDEKLKASTSPAGDSDKTKTILSPIGEIQHDTRV